MSPSLLASAGTLRVVVILAILYLFYIKWPRSKDVCLLLLCSEASDCSFTFPSPTSPIFQAAICRNISFSHRRYRIGVCGRMRSDSTMLETSLWIKDTLLQIKRKTTGFPFLTSNSAYKEGLQKDLLHPHRLMVPCVCLFLCLAFYPNFVRGLHLCVWFIKHWRKLWRLFQAYLIMIRIKWH